MIPPATQPGNGTVETGTVDRSPRHNWRPTAVHGVVAWLLLGCCLLLPLGETFHFGVTIVGLFTAPVVPVALYCDYRQARAFGECAPGAGAYLRNLGHDVLSTVTSGESLGSERGKLGRC